MSTPPNAPRATDGSPAAPAPQTAAEGGGPTTDAPAAEGGGPTSVEPAAPAGPLARAVRPLYLVLSSIWTGVALFLFLFAYSSIGSALPPVRQLPVFEMTEFEWFHWWPFDVAVTLLCVTIVLATLRHVPFTLLKAGTWLAHAGLLILVAGSWYYFSTKIEGDTPVIRRQVVIEVPGAEPARLVALPGAAATVGEGADAWRFEVASIRPDWPILSGDDAGQNAYSVSVRVVAPEREFIRQLLAGYPQYTEDIIPGKGRAVRETGEKLLDEDLKLTLEYEPARYFYVADSSALYVRPAGARAWSERPIRGLPRYNDYTPSREDVWHPDGAAPIDPHPLNLAVGAAEMGDPLDGADVRVVGYLRYARPERRWTPGGTGLNPVVAIRLEAPDLTGMDYRLHAFDPERWSAEDGLIAFRWHDDALPPLPTDTAPLAPHLHISVPEAGVSLMHLVEESVAVQGEDLAYTSVGDTGYSFRVRFLSEPITAVEGKVLNVAVVEVRAPDGTAFTRWVADDPNFTRDMRIGDGMPTEASAHDFVATDERIAFEFTPGFDSAWITLRATPDAIVADIRSTLTGKMRREPIAVGESLTLESGLRFYLLQYLREAKPEVRPAIVPRHERDRDLGVLYSMVKVEITAGGVTQSAWLPFHQYPFESPAYRARGRFIYAPTPFQLADGRRIEMIYSREREPLPAAVALDDFHLNTHTGGYTGNTLSIRNWTSKLRFETAPGRWGDVEELSVNAPVERGGFWFFQSSWDPPDGAQGDYAGLNYTGLGVGNRQGVHIQLLGAVIAVLGMLFAFYAKPVLLRRRAAERGGEAGDTAYDRAAVSAPPLEIPAASRPIFAGYVGVVALSVALLVGSRLASMPAEAEPSAFARAVDLSPLASVAVQGDGRLRSFESHAEYFMRMVLGPRRFEGQSAGFTYLDKIFRPEYYAEHDVVFVKNRQLRVKIAQAASFAGPEVSGLLRDDFLKSGLVSPRVLAAPPVRSTLDTLKRDLIRWAKHVEAVESAVAVSNPALLADRLRLLPRQEGDADEPWHSAASIVATMPAMPAHGATSAQTGFNLPAPLPGVDADTTAAVAGAWEKLGTAWRAENAGAVNAAAARLADALHAAAPGRYPDTRRLALESWYFHHGNMTWIWLVYALSVLVLLLALVYKWPGAQALGLGVFGAAFALHTAALVIRWYVAGRWPNSNMFEAVTTAAWGGAVVALVFEWFARRTPMRNLFLLTSACASMTAMMAAHFLPLSLNPTISNRMPVLHDVWLYIHTNVIILSYCLIAMAAVTGALYLAWRLAGGGADFARVGGTALLLRRRLPAGEDAPRLTPGQVFDGVTMILIELSFVLLWSGIVMGAMWADHSWGRPWGWDPKEVFALNTFFVYLALVHIRFVVRDKGLWTAALALIGCGVMLFNWIVINFVISGLHSYA